MMRGTIFTWGYTLVALRASPSRQDGGPQTPDASGLDGKIGRHGTCKFPRAVEMLRIREEKF